MNRNKLKAYAPQARREFIKAVTDRAAFYGLTENNIEPITEQGDVAIIAGKAFPRVVAAKRKRLVVRVRRQGFEQVMEAMAYTWFNRFVAIRFMELHGYFDHGYRVLSHPEGSATPEILEHAEHVDLSGLDRDKVIELKLEGTKEAELYQMLLVAQCNALHKAMPFLFEWVDDETELLLPENLLHSDSVIRKLVNEIAEEDWQQVEIIGWLYQFYISEKHEQVIGKVVKSEDIPAATQRFTPNWIVKYLVQNSLGRLWLSIYPNSPLLQQMEYYIEPADQTPEVQEQLKAITPESLNPEELMLLDPACGSGHILVEAYDLLKAIYQERGYRGKDIPRLILEKNLYGLEIDDRAAQLAAFALIMKAFADDRLISEKGTHPHVLAIQESKGLDAGEITEALNAPILKTELPPRKFLVKEMEDERAPLFSRKNLSVKGEVSQTDVAQLIDLYKHGKTLGSLIRVPEDLIAKLPAIAQRVYDVLTFGRMFEQAFARLFRPIVEQSRILAVKYDAVIANPPYMGARSGMNLLLKSHVNEYPCTKADLYAMFIERGLELAKPAGFDSMVTMHGWMFLTTYERMREMILSRSTIESLAHLGPRAFSTISGEVVQVAAFNIRNTHIPGLRPIFFRLVEGEGEQKKSALLQRLNRFQDVAQDDFRCIPGSPIAYWATEQVRTAFQTSDLLSEIAESKQGMATSDNNRFLRFWHEVAFDNICFGCLDAKESERRPEKWYPYNKGGSFRRWYGNNEHVVNWQYNGRELRTFVNEINRLRPGGRLKNQEYYYRKSITYSALSGGLFACRYNEPGFLFDTKGSCVFVQEDRLLPFLGYLNSVVAQEFLNILCPTLDYSSIGINRLPVRPAVDNSDIVSKMVAIAKADWDSQEESWDFLRFCLLDQGNESRTIEDAFHNRERECRQRCLEMQSLEDRNNIYLIDEYGLQGELSPKVKEDQITLYRPIREEDIKQLVSYAVGCMMGRYSLNKPGLIYAHSGNKGFDASQYKTVAADEDGIIPITDTDWFEDDAANLVVGFISVAWPREHLKENLKFVAESLGPKQSGSSRETIRRYLATGFYKHHLSMYKKRPIYWLFSSGKERAFQCLVYLHRYNEGTLSRMRTQYLIPLQGKMSARISQLAGDIAAATSTSRRMKLERERDKIIKQQAELLTFDEKLRHYADQRISLDLDDGVKVNYGKFGGLLAEVETVAGKR